MLEKIIEMLMVLCLTLCAASALGFMVLIGSLLYSVIK